MRVITGRAKGRRLQSVPGDSTRPITDRAKEALFSILGDWIIDTRVLDMFGGTGAVGIEALSRGATFAQFIDRNRRATETILSNLRHCQLQSDAQVHRDDSFAFVEKYSGEPFDFIYIAPPQYRELWRKALLQFDKRPELLAPDGIIAVQIHPREDAPIELDELVEYDRRKYGSVLLIFYANKVDFAEDADDDNESDIDGVDTDSEA